jgi:hypothetical protein
MLSRRQTWRKLKSKSDNSSSIFLYGDQNTKYSEGEIYESKITDNTANEKTKEPFKLKSALSMNDLSKALRQTPDRNLRFSSKVHVCLIPCRQDLTNVAIDIYWNSTDYVNFKKEAVDELRSFLQQKKISAKEAIQLLYQPEPAEMEMYYKSNPEECKSNEFSKSANETKIETEFNSKEEIKLGFKTDVEINMENGTLKTLNKGSGSMWAVQWQASNK